MVDRLAGKVAIVTGAGSGMGKAISQLFAKEGAKVVLADINAQGIEEVKQAIEQAGGQAAAKVTNVVKQEDVDGVIDFATQTFGQLDILVNNAGIMDNFTPVGNLTDAEYERVMAINLTGPVKLCRAAIQVMEKQETGGVIINNASVGGLFGTRGGAAYTMAKHALVGLTKNIAGTTDALVRCGPTPLRQVGWLPTSKPRLRHRTHWECKPCRPLVRPQLVNRDKLPT